MLVPVVVNVVVLEIDVVVLVTDVVVNVTDVVVVEKVVDDKDVIEVAVVVDVTEVDVSVVELVELVTVEVVHVLHITGHSFRTESPMIATLHLLKRAKAHSFGSPTPLHVCVVVVVDDTVVVVMVVIAMVVSGGTFPPEPICAYLLQLYNVPCRLAQGRSRELPLALQQSES